MPSSNRFPVRIAIKEGPAGRQFLTLELVGISSRDAFNCDSLHFHLRDGTSTETAKALVRDMNGAIDSLSIQSS